MKTTQNATQPKETLINYILNLTPAQVDKLIERLPLLKQLAGMSKNELIFSETFLEKVCGRESA